MPQLYLWMKSLLAFLYSTNGLLALVSLLFFLSLPFFHLLFSILFLLEPTFLSAAYHLSAPVLFSNFCFLSFFFLPFLPSSFPSALLPQARSVYRFGALSDCSDKLDDFKFCLSMKALSPEERRDVWIRRRAEKSAAQRSQLEKSSEGVWEMRR